MVSGDLVAFSGGAHAGDRLIRWCTTISVVVLAWIAAVLSYKHMYELVLRYGETSWSAALLPVSVDGMIVASSLTLLADSRAGRRGGLLPWALLLAGSAASLAANVAVAEPSMIGRVIAAWPSCALIGSYELLMRQVRKASHQKRPVASHEGSDQVPAGSEISYEVHTAPHMGLIGNELAPDEVPTTQDLVTDAEASDGSQMYGLEDLVGNAEESPAAGAGEANGAHPGRCRPVARLQRQAWHWAVANRTLAGELPAGKVIAERFGRCERWGRLVKRTGLTGGFDR
ncbi:DUF2637 domain-containing protein [Actinomadura sp. KC06]|uniref:DUF2637 domain-containing protein n=1 Tax=Actinomadura sp. KC06 TaxID=2530369 RepID=UPI001051F7F7|nr:DUF2637 domain-containing protein [Actinomadura sp. KC06]TDD32747.1 DUF2637 domain-containing protein [Actinomadura sp. KC06]